MDEGFGAKLSRSVGLKRRRRDTVAEAYDPRREAEVKVRGPRKKSIAWVGEMTGKIRRGLKGVTFGRKRSPAGLGPVGQEGEEGASPLLAPSTPEMRFLPLSTPSSPGRPRGPCVGWTSVRSPTDAYYAALATPSLASRSDHPISSPSSAHYLTSPHPDYDDPATYITALTEHLERKIARGCLEEDVLDFRFAGAAGNQEDGVESLFYARSEIGEDVERRRGSLEERIEEVRLFGPDWARREVLQLREVEG